MIQMSWRLLLERPPSKDCLPVRNHFCQLEVLRCSARLGTLGKVLCPQSNNRKSSGLEVRRVGTGPSWREYDELPEDFGGASSSLEVQFLSENEQLGPNTWSHVLHSVIWDRGSQVHAPMWGWEPAPHPVSPDPTDPVLFPQRWFPRVGHVNSHHPHAQGSCCMPACLYSV